MKFGIPRCTSTLFFGYRHCFFLVCGYKHVKLLLLLYALCHVNFDHPFEQSCGKSSFIVEMTIRREVFPGVWALELAEEDAPCASSSLPFR